MSNVKPTAKQTVNIKENDLVNLIDDILTEAIEVEKTKWIAEQAVKEAKNTALFESRLKALENALLKK